MSVKGGSCQTALISEVQEFGPTRMNAMLDRQAWADLNTELEGSPYLLPNSELGHHRAEVIRSRCERIERDYTAARRSFATQSQEVQDRLAEIATGRLVYESNALEGVGLSFSETAKVVSAVRRGDLDSYLTERAIKSDVHLMEVLGLEKASRFADDLVQGFRTDRAVRESDLRSLHQLAVPHEDFAGSYKSKEVEIGGAAHTPHSMLDVPMAMNDLCDWLNQPHSNPALSAAVSHSWLTHIHPFEDGNGRVARLLGTVMLLKQDWPPLVVRGSDRTQYLDALSHSDSGGDILPLFDLFVKSLKSSIRMLESPELVERLLDEEISGNAEIRYRYWMDQLDAFIKQLRQVLADGDIRVDRLTVPSLTALTQLEDRNSSGNFWLCKARTLDGTTDVLIWVGYMSDLLRDYSPKVAPSLFFGVRDNRGDAEHSYFSDFRGGAIAIDEISLLPVASEFPALVKRSGFVDEMSLQDAAVDLATAIAATKTLE